MPLVYVHGVGNRRGSANLAVSKYREELFRRHLLPSVTGCRGEHKVYAPHWGDLGGILAWNGASMPRGAVESLGARKDDPVALTTAAAMAAAEAGGATDLAPDRILVHLARTSLADAIDLLFTVITDDGLPEDQAVELAALGSRLAFYCHQWTSAAGVEDGGIRIFSWLAEARDDEEFLVLLGRQLQAAEQQSGSPGTGVREQESLGPGSAAWSLLSRGARRLRRTATGVTTGAGVRGARRIFGHQVSAVFGDLTAYLAARGTPRAPGPILQRVGKSLELASTERGDDLPLIVVAHSLGGVITHDLLSTFQPNVHIDVLVTVGSQVGLFEEMKLLASSKPDIPGDLERAPALSNVDHWLNVVDRTDPLAFYAAPIFDGVVDYAYATGSAWAHTAYLRQPNFHVRLSRRLSERFVPPS
ncbi:hypothetical protein ACQPZP_04845 [Spirillospora sp. CA-142024]|uniref:hypothetical protein n=1 Tax=Spirillospora sp. CA-142024 TaxID=3240036 RepID=UPI003D8A6B7E